jgi:hypothetical protein
MSDDLSREEQQRGTRRVMAGGAVIAFVIAVLSLAWIFVPTSSQRTDTSTGQRSVQTQGASTAARNTEAPPASSPNSSNPETVGRNQEITGSSAGGHGLEPRQIEAVKTVAASAPRNDTVNFTVSVGAAVPRTVQLQDMPRSLGDALPSYINDQYAVVGNQFLIVEKSTRRIVAIVPVG